MRETAVAIESTDVLVGIYTEPAEPADGRLPGVLFLTAGVVHRSGPFRMHTELARRLSARGFPCFRFDQAGVGDSANRSAHVSDQVGAAQDASLAMDFLESRHGVRQFILFGLCSGADNAHYVAVRDPRVAGMISLDAFAYPTAGYLARRYLRFARNPRHVYRTALSKLRAGRHAAPSCDGNQPHDGEWTVRVFEREFPPHREVANEIETLARRGVQALYIYSGGYAFYNYAGQFFRNFPAVRRHPHLEVEYFPDADHTYLLMADRRRLYDRVERWAVSRFVNGPADRLTANVQAHEHVRA